MTKRLSAATLATVLAVTMAAAGCGADPAHQPSPGVPTAVTRSLASSPGEGTPTPQVEPPTTETPGAAAIGPRVPTRLRLWRFDAPVIPIDLDGTTLVPPSDPRVLGWWGRRAAAARGTTLLVGHTVSTGGGTFDDLEHTPVGEVARVSGARYRVQRVAVITKAQLARRAQRLFDQTGPHRLVLVTCEGWNPATRTYSDNVVLVATPAW